MFKQKKDGSVGKSTNSPSLKGKNPLTDSISINDFLKLSINEMRNYSMPNLLKNLKLQDIVFKFKVNKWRALILLQFAKKNIEDFDLYLEVLKTRYKSNTIDLIAIEGINDITLIEKQINDGKKHYYLIKDLFYNKKIDFPKEILVDLLKKILRQNKDTLKQIKLLINENVNDISKYYEVINLDLKDKETKNIIERDSEIFYNFIKNLSINEIMEKFNTNESGAEVMLELARNYIIDELLYMKVKNISEEKKQVILQLIKMDLEFLIENVIDETEEKAKEFINLINTDEYVLKNYLKIYDISKEEIEKISDEFKDINLSWDLLENSDNLIEFFNNIKNELIKKYNFNPLIDFSILKNKMQKLIQKKLETTNFGAKVICEIFNYGIIDLSLYKNLKNMNFNQYISYLNIIQEYQKKSSGRSLSNLLLKPLLYKKEDGVFLMELKNFIKKLPSKNSNETEKKEIIVKGRKFIIKDGSIEAQPKHSKLIKQNE